MERERRTRRAEDVMASPRVTLACPGCGGTVQLPAGHAVIATLRSSGTTTWRCDVCTFAAPAIAQSQRRLRMQFARRAHVVKIAKRDRHLRKAGRIA